MPLIRILCTACALWLVATIGTISPASEAADTATEKTVAEHIDGGFGVVVGYMAEVLFFKIPIVPSSEPLIENGDVIRDEAGNPIYPWLGLPFIIVLLVAGGLFFTVRTGFINIRLFRHAIHCVRGKYDNPDDDGEVSHFKALTSALSATVGLGNIAGVAVAITAGGPGAVFWMWFVAFFGMSMKFFSCTLAQVYRRIKPDGVVLGGPMVYLEDGIRERVPALAPVGKGLAILFAILCIGGSFGGGNMFQGNMTYAVTKEVFGISEAAWVPWAFGVVLAVMVGLVIIGGIRRIGSVTAKLVPTMCGFYCLVCLIIICANIGAVPSLIADIFSQAFTPNAAITGGFIGVLVQGMKRAAFSNEAGLGSAAIAHAAAKTKEPIREGMVAMLGPFIDTILVCTMTALAILITNVHEGADPKNWVDGSLLTADAFRDLHEVFAYFLVIAVWVFAYSTMISWSYYGERASEYLFGNKGIKPYRIVYVIVVAFGPVMSLTNVLDFSDLMLLSMAFPNIIGMAILSPVVVAKLKDYHQRYRSGQMPVASDWRTHHPTDLGPAERQAAETSAESDKRS